MNTEPLSHLKIASLDPSSNLDTENLETMVGVHLLNDLNSQLADISRNMEEDLHIKQGLRQEMGSLQNLATQVEAIEKEGKFYHDLNENQLAQLGYPEAAIPHESPESGETLYRLHEEDFDELRKQAIDQRKETLSQMNSQGEITMIKIQSLVDQRKQALTLLSHLLAASHQVAQTIIGNIKS